MTCKNCIHYDVCLDWASLWGDNQVDNMSHRKCKDFKYNKSILDLDKLPLSALNYYKDILKEIRGHIINDL